ASAPGISQVAPITGGPAAPAAQPSTGPGSSPGTPPSPGAPPAPGGGGPPAAGFSASAVIASQVVVAGNKATYLLTFARPGGFADPVALGVDGLPAGASAVFSPNPATGASSTLTVMTAHATPPGTYTLHV